MKFVCTSDTHSFHEALPIPGGDVFIHAGDFTGNGSFEDVERFNEFLGGLPHRFKIVIAGNHDWALERNAAKAEEILTNCCYLRDREITIEGIRIYGSPWQPWFNDWAFNLPRGAALKAMWDLIPMGIDVLITHGPPKSRLDEAPRVSGGGTESVGCADLLEAVRRTRPRYHVFGHVHEGYGVTKDETTTYVNASLCDGRYNPVNPPIVFELGANDDIRDP